MMDSCHTKPPEVVDRKRLIDKYAKAGGVEVPATVLATPASGALRDLAPLMSDDKPYRPNVGVALFNASGQVLIGRRFRDDGPEIILPGLEWQMPQGGIDADEDPREAVMRELWEETGVANATYLGETDWLTYDFPPFAGPQSHRLAKFRGQRQKWFALRFTGHDDEVDPLTPRNSQPPEFDQWRWERLDRVADLVVPFRREVYREVARNFARFL
jgi:putative (di)nucleoside polyphosphate hydrolase